MCKRKNNNEADQYHRKVIQVLLRYFLYSISFTLFFFSLSLAGYNLKKGHGDHIEDSKCFLFSDYSSSHHSPLDFPFNTTPGKETNTDESELKEKVEKRNSLPWNLTDIFGINEIVFSSFWNSVSQITLSLQNRPTVPLFLLHSAWKSYLSN